MDTTGWGFKLKDFFAGIGLAIASALVPAILQAIQSKGFAGIDWNKLAEIAVSTGLIYISARYFHNDVKAAQKTLAEYNSKQALKLAATSTRVHKTFFGKIFGSAFDAVKNAVHDLFVKANNNFLEASVLVTNALKTFLSNNIVLTAVDLTSTNVDNELVAIANKYLPIILADEVLLQKLDASTTEADIKKAMEDVANSFGTFSDLDKEELYTAVAAKLYIIYQEIKSGKKVTFGEAATLVETAYQIWLKRG